jgi:phospholipid/cholesterol/gamma-HCH transport system substrate-binding protein
MRRLSQRIMGAVVVVPIALAATGCSIGMQEMSFDWAEGRQTYPLDVQLSTADLVMVGSEVRLGQQLLGRVTGLKTVASMNLDEATDIPRNASFTVELPNTLGNPYLRVRIPDDASPEIYQGGDLVPEEMTDRGPDLENALASLALVLSEGGIGSIEVIANEMEAAIGDRGTDINRLVAQLRVTADTLSAQSDNIDRILQAAASSSQLLADERESFERGLDSAQPVFDLLIDQWDYIADLLGGTAGMSQELNAILTASEEDLLALPADLANLLEDLNREDIGSVLNALNKLLEGASNTRRGDYLTFDGDADVPEALNNLIIGTPGGGR